MNPAKLLALLAVAALVALPVVAQEPTAPTPAPAAEKGPEMDDASKTLFDNWDKVRYHLTGAGVKKASCKVTVKSVMKMMGQEQKMDAGAVYTWDGSQGAFKWDEGQGGMGMGQQLKPDREIDDLLIADEWKKDFAGAKMTATPGENGTVVNITGGGTQEGRLKSLHFDANGMPVKGLVEAQGPMGNMEVNITWKYAKVGDKYVRSESAVAAEIPGMGALNQTTKYTYEKQGDYYVRTRADMTMTMGQMGGGTRTLLFTDWKFNDDVQ